jgi:hypothetical protein
VTFPPRTWALLVWSTICWNIRPPHSPPGLDQQPLALGSRGGLSNERTRLCKTDRGFERKKKRMDSNFSFRRHRNLGWQFPPSDGYISLGYTNKNPRTRLSHSGSYIYHTNLILKGSICAVPPSRRPLCQNKINPERSEIGWIGSLSPRRLWRDRWVSVLQTGYMAGAYLQNPDHGDLERGRLRWGPAVWYWCVVCVLGCVAGLSYNPFSRPLRCTSLRIRTW